MNNEQKRAASQPHERFLFNLAIFHFFVPAILFGTENLWLVFTIPLFASTMILISIGWQAKQSNDKSALVLAHWQLAWRRSIYLLIVYGVSLLIFIIGVLLTMNTASSSDQFIQRAVIGWFALAPLSLALVALLIIEGSALVQSRNGVMPADMKL
ncbi:MAG TPA: hypothetical protein VFM76_07270 [Methylophaga sp.]|nr:hypothetical protein [Methylophaga sp.]